MATALVLLALLGPLAVLTAIGARERGASPVAAVVAGAFFPVAWTVWYVRDDLAQRRSTRADA